MEVQSGRVPMIRLGRSFAASTSPGFLDLDGKSLWVGQPSYVRELLNRHGVKSVRDAPFQKWGEVEDELDPSPDGVIRAQGYIGELLWLSIRTRPDLSYGVSQMGQVAMRRPKWVCSCAIEMLEYLAGFPDRCLAYTEGVSRAAV